MDENWLATATAMISSAGRAASCTTCLIASFVAVQIASASCSAPPGSTRTVSTGR